ncbi:MAG: DUF4406 domain-containing protein [Acidobacteria bacterium]|nr:DUF4406 domain-containing protein [Acidobacteriota bacterium]
MRIYIAGPYTALSEAQTLQNVQRAIDAALKLYERGHLPYIPHLTHWVDKRAKEIGIEITHDDYIRRWESGWLALCDALLFLGESPGACEELELAKQLGKRIYYGDASVVPPSSTKAKMEAAEMA